MKTVLTGLNPKQQEAVSLPPQHALVLAGAGSGKTRVLIHRLAWLMTEEKVSPYEILAVTFTNKAANEMRQRIENLFAMPTQGLWVGTFHGLSHRILRRHWQEAGLTEAFQVIDSDDQLRLLKRIISEQGLDDKRWTPKLAQAYINKQKEEGRRAQQVRSSGDYFEQGLLKVYFAYERQCQQSSLVDFAELLLRPVELMQKQPHLRSHYQQRFRHLLVDEFQDTNAIQYQWLQQFSAPTNTLMVVGDDDQSIYGWRGAKIENIQRFQQQFQPVVVRLEQNYRSTKTILEAANAVIAHNQARMGKTLWTDGEAGAPIKLYAAFNELDEARYVISQVQQAKQAGCPYQEIALLYRSNAQSRVLEEALLQAAIPYRIYGGMRFFERAEIKDALAYLRLIFNRHDDAAFERVINVPSRGIGERSLQSIRDRALTVGVSLWQAANDTVQNQALTARACNAIQGFLQLIEHMAEKTATNLLSEQVEYVIKKTNLTSHFAKESQESQQARLENLGELVTAAQQFQERANAEEAVTTPLATFLTHAVLEAGEGQAEQYEDAVQLMTVHAAKGLEFSSVFLVGMEDELFPGRRAEGSLAQLEEERRLCYVGITRAREQLTLTYAEYRRWYGENRLHHPSRFIRELPNNCIEVVRFKSQLTRPQVSSMHTLQPNSGLRRYQTSTSGLQASGQTWYVGQQVAHPKFGSGVILNYEGQGENARVQVQFQEVGMKWLVIGYANLTAAKETMS